MNFKELLNAYKKGEIKRGEYLIACERGYGGGIMYGKLVDIREDKPDFWKFGGWFNPVEFERDETFVGSLLYSGVASYKITPVKFVDDNINPMIVANKPSEFNEDKYFLKEENTIRYFEKEIKENPIKEKIIKDFFFDSRLLIEHPLEDVKHLLHKPGEYEVKKKTFNEIMKDVEEKMKKQNFKPTTIPYIS